MLWVQLVTLKWQVHVGPENEKVTPSCPEALPKCYLARVTVRNKLTDQVITVPNRVKLHLLTGLRLRTMLIDIFGKSLSDVPWIYGAN